MSLFNNRKNHGIHPLGNKMAANKKIGRIQKVRGKVVKGTER